MLSSPKGQSPGLSLPQLQILLPDSDFSVYTYVESYGSLSGHESERLHNVQLCLFNFSYYLSIIAASTMFCLCYFILEGLPP